MDYGEIINLFSLTKEQNINGHRWFRTTFEESFSRVVIRKLVSWKFITRSNLHQGYFLKPWQILTSATPANDVYWLQGWSKCTVKDKHVTSRQTYLTINLQICCTSEGNHLLHFSLWKALPFKLVFLFVTNKLNDPEWLIGGGSAYLRVWLVHICYSLSLIWTISGRSTDWHIAFETRGVS